MFLGFRSAWRTRSRGVPTILGGSVFCAVRHQQPLPRPHSTQPSPSDAPKAPSQTDASETPSLPGTPKTRLFSPPYSDDEPRLRSRYKFVHSNHARNETLRHAFRDESPAIREDVKHKLSSPFVPPARDYPTPLATRRSMDSALLLARVHVGFDLMPLRHEASRIPDWTEILDTLKRTTPRIDAVPRMAALRIVMPESMDLAIENRDLDFIELKTGLAAKLRLAVDRRHSSAFVLRGRASVLARAADELVAACEGVQVFQLGHVATHDYETRQLWPSIQDVPNADSEVPSNHIDGVWAHRERKSYWIDVPYEQVTKPDSWTEDTLQQYVSSLACGRLRPHLAKKFYHMPGPDGHLVDTDGRRVALILEAIEDPLARDCLTPSILKRALVFMAHRGGHRVSAERLIDMAEQWGVPMDTDVFNIMLHGYVTNNDVAFFYRALRKMASRFLQPNARTWLLFLELVKKDDQRRQIIAAMYELGFLDELAARRAIAEIMAGYNSYVALRSGMKIQALMAKQAVRFGADWLTPSALNATLKEFFMFHSKSHPDFRDFRVLLEEQLPKSVDLGLDTFNLVLEYCAVNRDWTTALWALAQMRQRQLEPDHDTYRLLLLLARKARTATALGIVFFYGVLARQLRTKARDIVDKVLLQQNVVAFWKETRPRIFSREMARHLKQSPLKPTTSPAAGVEWAILKVCEGYTPKQSLVGSLGTAIRAMDAPAFQEMMRLDVGPSAMAQPDDYAIRLRDLQGRLPSKVVHLDARFDPCTMVRSASDSPNARSPPAAAPVHGRDGDDAASPPEDKAVPPPPEDDKATTSPPEDKAAPPPEDDKAASPPPQDHQTASSSPEDIQAAPPPPGDRQAVPSRPEDLHAAPQPPKDEKAVPPTPEDDKSATSPPEDKAAPCPPEDDKAASPTPKCHQAAPSPREDHEAAAPPPEDEKTALPPSADEIAARLRRAMASLRSAPRPLLDDRPRPARPDKLRSITPRRRR